MIKPAINGKYKGTSEKLVIPLTTSFHGFSFES